VNNSTQPDFPPFEAAQRVGNPQITIDPPEFHVAEVYQVKFVQKLAMSPPATDGWYQLFASLISGATSGRVEVRVSDDGEAILVGTLPEPELKSTVSLIDQALEKGSESYYPTIYDSDKADWERWREVRANLKEQEQHLAGPNARYFGEPRTGSMG
jgi:hypothetical protein